MLRLLHPTGFAFWRKFLNSNLWLRKMTFRKNLKNQLRMFSHMIQKVISELVFYFVKKDWSQIQVEIRNASERLHLNRVKLRLRKMVLERFIQQKDSLIGISWCFFLERWSEVSSISGFWRNKTAKWHASFWLPSQLHVCHDLKKQENQKTHLAWNSSVSFKTVHLPQPSTSTYLVNSN